MTDAIQIALEFERSHADSLGLVEYPHHRSHRNETIDINVHSHHQQPKVILSETIITKTGRTYPYGCDKCTT